MVLGWSGDGLGGSGCSGTALAAPRHGPGWRIFVPESILNRPRTDPGNRPTRGSSLKKGRTQVSPISNPPGVPLGYPGIPPPGPLGVLPRVPRGNPGDAPRGSSGGKWLFHSVNGCSAPTTWPWIGLGVTVLSD
jgi:hypothetical protein